jgi:hypothetical protein
MNLYLIKQNVNCDYDTYDSAVVIASSEEEARTIHPDGQRWEDNKWYGCWGLESWCRPEHVEVKLIGTAATGNIGDVVVRSFNAG